jgi:hypothetical protein
MWLGDLKIPADLAGENVVDLSGLGTAETLFWRGFTYMVCLLPSRSCRHPFSSRC